MFCASLGQDIREAFTGPLVLWLLDSVKRCRVVSTVSAMPTINILVTLFVLIGVCQPFYERTHIEIRYTQVIDESRCFNTVNIVKTNCTSKFLFLRILYY